MLPCAVIITIGRRSSCRLTRFSSSSPDSPGRTTSHSTISGRRAVELALALRRRPRRREPRDPNPRCAATALRAARVRRRRRGRQGVSTPCDVIWAARAHVHESSREKQRPRGRRVRHLEATCGRCTRTGAVPCHCDQRANDDQEARRSPRTLGLIDRQAAGDLAVLRGLRRRVRRVLAREDLVLAFGQRDRAVRRRSIFVNFAGSSSRAGAIVARADEQEALLAFGRECPS